MKSEWKEKWLKALRSGDYDQGEGLLRRSGKDRDQFCCLGVLADLIDPNGWEGHLFRGEVCFLTNPDLEKVGLKSTTQNTLSGKNDDGETFDEIADYIERRIPG